ncbi:hypothetical protein DSM112329_00753 [Paraconexibacter sp. AEG42_29]|uniref:PucR family transcriptional regulator n=1 Tax=Paraconexibacter sp. AEG42_29 TaxID=2997339 RepID=A0AAU7AQL1_9ACTN
MAGDIDARIEQIALDLQTVVLGEIPALAQRPALKEGLMDVARGSATLLTAMARSWSDPAVVAPPQDSLDWARSLVEHGLPSDTLLRVFRVGQARYQAEWHRALTASGATPLVILEAVQAISAFSFKWVDAISGPLTDAHVEETARRLRGIDAVRSAELARVLRGDHVDETVASGRLGYDLRREHTAVHLWVEPGAPGQARDRLEAVLAEIHQQVDGQSRARPLTARVSPAHLRAWFMGPIATPSAANLDALLRPDGIRAAVGTRGTGLAGFIRTADEAERAQRVATLLRFDRTLTRFSDVAVVDLLTRDVDAARRFAVATLGPLGEDRVGPRRLLATLACFYGQRQSYAQTARALGLHVNTVAYRVRRAAELSGFDDATAGPLHAATLLAPLIDGDPHSSGSR